MIEKQYSFPMIPDEDRRLPLCVYTAGYENFFDECSDCQCYRPNGIPDHQFLFVTNGELTTVFDKKKLTVKENGFMYHSPHTRHEYIPTSFPIELYYVTFNTNNYTIFELKNGVFQLSNISGVVDIISKMIQLQRDISYGKKASVLLYQLILELNEMISKKNTGNNSKLQPVMDYLNENFTRELDLNTLAEVIDVTPEYFCRLFKKYYHMRPFEYVQRLRIQKAKNLMFENRNLSISEISQMVGYQHASYFIKLFKKQETITPMEFRMLYI